MRYINRLFTYLLTYLHIVTLCLSSTALDWGLCCLLPFLDITIPCSKMANLNLFTFKQQAMKTRYYTVQWWDNGALRPFKVIQGHRVWCQSTATWATNAISFYSLRDIAMKIPEIAFFTLHYNLILTVPLGLLYEIRCITTFIIE